MKALAVTEFKKPLEVLELPDPTLTPDGVIIRVEANGICRSDWHMWMGDFIDYMGEPNLPLVMGHEFVGVIEEVGRNIKNFKKGDRVIAPFSQGDGVCEYCLSGHSNVCANASALGYHYWGGYGEYVHIPDADINLIHLPENIDPVTGAGLGCRFMTAYHGLMDQVTLRPGEWVAIHGCGGIGLSSVHIASAIGANVIAVDINEDTLKLAKELGAAITLNAGEKDVASEIVELTKGGAHVSVDALGIQNTCSNAINSLRRRGRHLQIGLTNNEENSSLRIPVNKIVGSEIMIVGSLGMQISRLPSMLDMVERDILKPGKLVTNTVSIEEAGNVLKSMSEYNTVGVTVVDRW